MSRICQSPCFLGAFVVSLVIAGAAQVRAFEIVEQGPEACSAEQSFTPDAHCQPACSECGCGCDQRCPWEVSTDFVYLQRRSPDRTILLQPSGGFGTNAAAARASDFNFDFEPGVDLSIVRNFGCDYGPLSAVEVRFLDVEDWHDSFATFLPTGDNVPFAGSQPFGNGIPQFWKLSYQSHLHSLELNLPYQLCSGLTALAGTRWVRLDERLEMDADAPSIPQTADFTFRTKNDLLGFQVGLKADSGPCCGRWRIDGIAKAGVYSNQASNSFGLAVTGNGGSIPGFGDSTDKVAFVGELGMGFNCLVTCHVTARVGYELLYADGVATASDQIPATDLRTRSGIDTNGCALYQGLNAGLTFCYQRFGTAGGASVPH